MKAFMSALPETGVITRSLCATVAALQKVRISEQFGACLHNVNQGRAAGAHMWQLSWSCHDVSAIDG
jgi:hypothetical protein